MLCQKKEQLADIREHLPKEALQSFDKSFEVEYTHNSTAIEGNTLTLIQTKAVLEDGISVGGKTLREIYEVVNHSKAFQFVKQCVAGGYPHTVPLPPFYSQVCAACSHRFHHPAENSTESETRFPYLLAPHGGIRGRCNPE